MKIKGNLIMVSGSLIIYVFFLKPRLYYFQKTCIVIIYYCNSIQHYSIFKTVKLLLTKQCKLFIIQVYR